MMFKKESDGSAPKMVCALNSSLSP